MPKMTVSKDDNGGKKIVVMKDEGAKPKAERRVIKSPDGRMQEEMTMIMIRDLPEPESPTSDNIGDANYVYKEDDKLYKAGRVDDTSEAKMRRWNKRHELAIKKDPKVRGLVAATVGYREFVDFNKNMDVVYRDNKMSAVKVYQSEIDGYVEQLREKYDRQLEEKLIDLAMEAAGICTLSEEPQDYAGIFISHFNAQFYTGHMHRTAVINHTNEDVATAGATSDNEDDDDIPRTRGNKRERES